MFAPSTLSSSSSSSSPHNAIEAVRLMWQRPCGCGSLAGSCRAFTTVTTTIGRQPFPLALTLALALLLDAAVDSRHFCARQSVRGLSVLASRCYALAATTSPGNGCEAGSYCDRETERCVLVDVAAWLAVAGLLPLSHTTIGRQPFPLALTLALALALLLDAAVDSRHFCARQSVRGLSVLASRCYALAATTSPGNGCEAGSYCDRETERWCEWSRVQIPARPQCMCVCSVRRRGATAFTLHVRSSSSSSSSSPPPPPPPPPHLTMQLRPRPVMWQPGWQLQAFTTVTHNHWTTTIPAGADAGAGLALLLDAAVDSRHFCARQSVRGLVSSCFTMLRVGRNYVARQWL
ncbi:hypothetical protein Aperf_G00000086881 [Anoplocephala perfoliata]